MFVLSALCVLLPLAAALDVCDQSTSDIFLAKRQLKGDLLDYFADKKFWYVASSTVGSNSSVTSLEVTFSGIQDNAVVGHFEYRNATGVIIQSNYTTYSLDEDHILAANTVEVYFFQCSKHLIAGYRCAVEVGSGNGPKFVIWAPWDKSDAVASRESPACEAELRKVDASATFAYRVHP